jgi:DNA adenine methylase
MVEPPEILDDALQRAISRLDTPFVTDTDLHERTAFVVRNLKNRAGVRLLMACLLAKLHKPEVDVRKPYTEIGTPDSFSGRSYDEGFLSAFIHQYELPCNPTTAFLTPALRNRNVVLTPDLNLVGKPPKLYADVLVLLDAVYRNAISATDLLAETVRQLCILRDENQARIASLLKRLETTKGTLPLSSEATITLIRQHLELPGTSRLPVLMIAAAYRAAEPYLRERVRDLHAHTAADVRTGALGDLEITLVDEDRVVTCYEVKGRKVTTDDVNQALHKLEKAPFRIDNYIFVTTAKEDEAVASYIYSLYEETDGIEFALLDAIGFLKHFLHLFHRLRGAYLEAYQRLMLEEPNTSVSQTTKEAFLAMRQAAEAHPSR